MRHVYYNDVTAESLKIYGKRNVVSRYYNIINVKNKKNTIIIYSADMTENTKNRDCRQRGWQVCTISDVVLWLQSTWRDHGQDPGWAVFAVIQFARVCV